VTAAELRDLFVATLLREEGGVRRDWRLVVGSVRVYDRATHPHCNWSLAPTGAAAQVEAVERLADRLREAHPIVTGR
jgi:hypothetical protein